MSEAGKLELQRKLKEKIKREGPITCEAFLDIVLYDDEFGYYREGKHPRQDYFTSPELHPLFGKIIARYIEEIRITCGRERLNVIELGGGSGFLAEQIISSAELHNRIDYVILEKGKKEEAGRSRRVSELNDLEPMKGLTIVVANEFFDALPFHRVVKTHDEMQEIYIDFVDGFAEQTGPLSTEVNSFLRSRPLALNLHQTSEVTTRAAEMLSRLDSIIEEGVLLMFDYGYHAEDLAFGRFYDGSMIGYRQFMIREDVFSDLGNVDITHHVNFDHLGAVLRDLGWNKAGETEQYRFLIGAGILEQMMMLTDTQRIAAKALIDPQGLGSMISVLGFTKNCSRDLPVFKPKNFFMESEKI